MRIFVIFNDVFSYPRIESPRASPLEALYRTYTRFAVGVNFAELRHQVAELRLAVRELCERLGAPRKNVA